MIRIETRKLRSVNIGMAPLVDCVMLLLIFFLLTTSFMGMRGLKIELPQASQSETMPKAVIEVQIDALGGLSFQGRKMDLPALKAALEKEASEKGARPVVLIADRQAPLGCLTDAIDCARAAGLDNVSIAAKPRETANP